MYRLNLSGRISGPFSESEIAEMYRKGSINITTLCQRSGTSGWVELDEVFPLLKYNMKTGIPFTRLPAPKLPSIWPMVVGFGGALVGILVFVLLSASKPTPPQVSDQLAAIPYQSPSSPPSATPIKSVFYQQSPQSVSPVVQPQEQPRQSTPSQPEEPAEMRKPTPEIVLPLATRRRQKEFQVPVFKDINLANYGGPDVWCRITQDSPSAIFIVWGGGRNRPTRYEKVTGFEGKNYTTLISVTGGVLYLVDSPRADPGKRIFVVD